MSDRIRTRYPLRCEDCGYGFVGPHDHPEHLDPSGWGLPPGSIKRVHEWTCPKCGGDGQPKEETKP